MSPTHQLLRLHFGPTLAINQTLGLSIAIVIFVENLVDRWASVVPAYRRLHHLDQLSLWPRFGLTLSFRTHFSNQSKACRLPFATLCPRLTWWAEHRRCTPHSLNHRYSLASFRIHFVYQTCRLPFSILSLIEDLVS